MERDWKKHNINITIKIPQFKKNNKINPQHETPQLFKTIHDETFQKQPLI